MPASRKSLWKNASVFTAAATLTAGALCVWMPPASEKSAAYEQVPESVYEIWPVPGNSDGLPAKATGMCMLSKMPEFGYRWFFVIPRPCVSMMRSIHLTDTGFESASPGAGDNIKVALRGSLQTDGSYLVQVSDEDSSFSFEMRRPRANQ